MEPKKEVKASQPKKTAKIVLKLKKSYHIKGYGQCLKGEKVTPELEKALKAINVAVSAVAE